MSKFESSRLYLTELLRLYGSRSVIVKIRQDGEVVEVLARTFVRRQLTSAGIGFPWNEINKRSPKYPNPELGDDELTILFHRGVFELESAYIEEFCQGKPEEEAFINAIYSQIERKKEWLDVTFSYYAGEDIVPFFEEEQKAVLEPGELSEGLTVTEEDVRELKKMGFKRISSIQAMMQVFWCFASYRKIIRNAMKNAILSITVDEEAADFLETYCHFYNSFIQGKIENNVWPVDEKQIREQNRKLQVELEERNRKHKEHYKKHLVELEERNRKYKELIKKYQEELQNINVRETEYRRIIDKFRKKVKNSNSKLFQTYDFTDENEIKNFISWHRVLNRKVKNETVKCILAKRFEDNSEDAELFLKMVEEYNSAFMGSSDDIDEETDTRDKADVKE